MAEQSTSSWLDRVSVAWAGPVLAAATVALAGGYVAARIDINSAVARIERIERDMEQHTEAFERFRQPGDRFTAADGARHDARIGRVEAACDECKYSRAEVIQRLKTIEETQRDICNRIVACRTGR